MADIPASRVDTNVPLTLLVTGIAGGVTGLSNVVAIRDGATDNSYLDFNDNTFKTSGHVTRQAALTDIGGGAYTLSGGLNVSAIGVPASTKHLFAEYEGLTSGKRFVDFDVIFFEVAIVGTLVEGGPFAPGEC